jgi:hypothetical protein
MGAKQLSQLWLNEVDCLCPWTIGRYSNEDEADNFADEKIKGDLRALKHKNDDNERRGDGKRMDYMPVVFPGGSVCEYTLSHPV